jgi:hypothetical protein
MGNDRSGGSLCDAGCGRLSSTPVRINPLVESLAAEGGPLWPPCGPQRWLWGRGAAGADGQKYAAAAGREIRARDGRGAAQDGPKSGARARGVVTSRRRGAPAPALAACCGTR